MVDRDSSNDYKKEISLKVVMIFCSVLMASFVSCAGFLFVQYVDLNLRITRIEGTCFTAKDMMSTHTEIAKIQREFASLPKEFPPPWFFQHVKSMEERLKSCEQDIRKR